jgi:nickel/cobalt exporter
MSHEITLLTVTAASIGFLHTVLGPDHYLPFIMMARARRWSVVKTGWITFLCGLGHVGSSVIIGIIGVALGISLTKLESVEAFRGDIAAWLFIAFGLAYFMWGLIRVIKNKPHTHFHVHRDGDAHIHHHEHVQDHAHTHDEKKSITPWVLFTIFVLGPCEPLIPILMYPAYKESLAGVILVAGVFCLVTVLTMLGIVLLATMGVNLLPIGRLERYTHAIAGAIICLSGVGIVFLGL